MAEAKSDILLDLDALAPPNITINYAEKAISVNPPDLKQYARIIDFSEKLTNSQKSAKKLDAIASIYPEINSFLKELIPELKEVNLTFAMTTALFKLMSEAGAPSDRAVAKLKEQGIDLKPKDAGPKASASSKQ